jgi:c-di-GMP-binding flagellar brake protein YcgR
MTGFKKRTHDRHTLSLYMEVYQDAKDKEPLFKSRTNNIGIGGLMMHNQGIKLRTGSKVKVILKATCRSGLKVFPVDAKVVWKTTEAIGLQFSPLNEIEQKNFKRFLFESKVAVHSGKRRRWRESTEITATITPPSLKEAALKRN